MDLNPGMLAVARALLPLPGAPITWVECSAVAMQLADATCDVVLCQQGLQFFPDRSGALREMHCVLRPGGRLVLSVWKKASPYTTAMCEVVERHIGPEAAARLSATTGLGDAEALHRLLVDTRFSDVHIRPSVMTIHVPPVAEFVLKHLAAMPVAGAVAALSEEVRTALGQDFHRALQSYVDGEGVAFPNAANLATAHA